MAEEAVQETTEENVSRETSEVTRPEWLPEKFKTGEDLVKSYESLESKMGQKDKDIREQVWQKPKPSVTKIAQKKVVTTPSRTKSTKKKQ